MDKFIARENIRHFRDRLETETDPNARWHLHRLLLEEEDKLGHQSEALDEIEIHIARLKDHVDRQQAFLASTQRDGRGITEALALFNAYSEILLAFANQREKILTGLRQARF